MMKNKERGVSIGGGRQGLGDPERLTRRLEINPNTIPGEILDLLEDRSPRFVANEEVFRVVGYEFDMRPHLSLLRGELSVMDSNIYSLFKYDQKALLPNKNEGDIVLPRNREDEISALEGNLGRRVCEQWRRCAVARVDDRHVLNPRFTLSEYAVLSTLFENFGQLVDHRGLVEIAGYDIDDFSHYRYGVRESFFVLISRIRRKIAEDDDLRLEIINRARVGYVLEWE